MDINKIKKLLKLYLRFYQKFYISNFKKYY